MTEYRYRLYDCGSIEKLEIVNGIFYEKLILRHSTIIGTYSTYEEAEYAYKIYLLQESIKVDINILQDEDDKLFFIAIDKYCNRINNNSNLIKAEFKDSVFWIESKYKSYKIELFTVNKMENGYSFITEFKINNINYNIKYNLNELIEMINIHFKSDEWNKVFQLFKINL